MIGLVLEGGAMRGLFTAGIIDVMMENNLYPDALIGVSAGAAFGCNMKSRQAGRAIRYMLCISKGTDPALVDTKELQKLLLEDGVVLE